MGGNRSFARIAKTLTVLRASPLEPSFTRAWFWALRDIKSVKCNWDFCCSLEKLSHLPDFHRLVAAIDSLLSPDAAEPRAQQQEEAPEEPPELLGGQAGCPAQRNSSPGPEPPQSPAGGSPRPAPDAGRFPTGVVPCPLDTSHSDESSDSSDGGSPPRAGLSVRPLVLDVDAPMHHLWRHVYGAEDPGKSRFKWEVRFPAARDEAQLAGAEAAPPSFAQAIISQRAARDFRRLRRAQNKLIPIVRDLQALLRGEWSRDRAKMLTRPAPSNAPQACRVPIYEISVAPSRCRASAAWPARRRRCAVKSSCSRGSASRFLVCGARRPPRSD